MEKFIFEHLFVEHLMPLILGGVYDGKSITNCYAEVPRTYGSDHSDILLICNKQVLIIEFKLNDYKKLYQQVERNKQKIQTIGIINTDKTFIKEYRRIMHYTGKDSQLDLIIQTITDSRWTSIYENHIASIYFWAYKNEPNNLKGGIKSGNRKSFYEIYMQAIKNLIDTYKTLDFYLCYRVLGFYSISVAKKYFQAVKNNNMDIYGKNKFERERERIITNG